MSLRNSAYDGILASLPNDPAVQARYFELVEIWESMGNPQDEARDFTEAKFEDLRILVHPMLMEREQKFFEEPFSADIMNSPSQFQALVTARLSKILMDRHGYKVTKSKGGLGT